jgi:hypothetical protein
MCPTELGLPDHLPTQAATAVSTHLSSHFESLGIKHPSGAYDQIFITVSHFVRTEQKTQFPV